MKLRFVLVATLMLGLSSQLAAADLAALRHIEVSELKRTLDPVLVASLDAEPRIAGRAALAVGRTKRPEGASLLHAHLDAADASERAMVVYGLGLLEDGTALERLRALARSDTSSAVRYAAVDAIGRIASARPELATREAALDILAVARSDWDAVVRAHAALQLTAFAGLSFAPEVARALQQLQFRERDQDVRWHIAWTIFRGYAGLADASFLRAGLRDKNELVRVETLRAWGRRKDAHAAASVRPLLRDPSWRVQLEAAEALKRLAGAAPTEHLTAEPPGLHVPKAAAFVAAPAVDTSPPAAAAARKQAAPDPAGFDLPAYARLPQTAAEMNGPANGPHPRVLIRTTKGDVVVKLYPEWAPSTVANFIALAQRGYFDGNRWFRIVPDFVVQTGDPNDNGEGDAGYTIPAEENPIEQRGGVIAMGLNYEGNHPLRDSAGTQFYVTLSPQPHLDRDFTAFGEIESGFNVLARLIERDRIVSVRRIADDRPGTLGYAWLNARSTNAARTARFPYAR